MIHRLLLFGVSLTAAGPASASIDEKIDALVSPVTTIVQTIILYPLPLGEAEVPFVVAWLVVAASVFTLYFGFVNLSGLRQGFRLIRGDYNDHRHIGEVTHFQALATALSGTVGLGNIAGVAIAVSVGGPGAVPWMMVAGFLGMSSKFCECTLGVKYRSEHRDGSVSGGPMWYLSRGLADRGPVLARVGKAAAAMFAAFAVAASFGGANMFQANQSFEQFTTITGGEGSWWVGKGWLFGVLLATLIGLVILGGIRSIARVASKIVPAMAVIYVLAAVVIIIVNIDRLPDAFGLMFAGMFGVESVAGGMLGVLAVGFQRAAFSSEAGVGLAAITHSAVRTNQPVTEGLVALYEPLIDTVIVCTLTGLVIVLSGAYLETAEMSGVALTSRAFETVIGWFPFVLALIVMMFAFSTMIAAAYYGMKSWTYLFGKTKRTENVYKALFLVFVVIGSAMQLGAVIGFSDAVLLAVAFPNILGMYFLMPKVKQELRGYMARVRSEQSGPRMNVDGRGRKRIDADRLTTKDTKSTKEKQNK